MASAGPVILNADDYAMTHGVSRAIEQLSLASRLSATSAMVTLPGWAEDARRISELRQHIAIGLHLNFTLGAPATRLRRLASRGGFPALRSLVLSAVTGRLEREEIAREIEAQLDLFERHLGFPPDHIDGHQHVQVLPVIRFALVQACQRRYGAALPLLRDPSARGRGKALVVRALSAGFRGAARRRGFPVNDAFAGFSDFDVTRDFSDELDDALRIAGRCPIVMCHPGFPDEVLAKLDPVVARRRQEYEALMSYPDLPERIWHPVRGPGGAVMNWAGA